MAELPKLKDVIARYELSANKALGQNFLLDSNLLAKIVRCAGDIKDQTVYEVGPGPGGLSRAILDAGVKKLVAVEYDVRAVSALADLAAHDARLTVIHGDALKCDEQQLIGEPCHIIANLPYNVGTALLVRWLTTDQPWQSWWQSLTLMFQKEVAERIVAKPDTEHYGRLAILAQWRAEAQIAMHVPAAAFTPAPKVNSAVVHIIPRKPLLDIPVKALETITAAAFGQRRKMLRTSLKAATADVAKLLNDASIDGNRRAETLSVMEFCQLAAALKR